MAHVRRGDTVVVLTGKEKGKRGKTFMKIISLAPEVL